MRYIFIFLIKFGYQKLRNKYNKDSSYCRFKPTCSEYSIIAFTKYGTIKGLKMTLKRIRRCNSDALGGNDYP
ncbi:MAG: membrane protein insertion efficiency factor YidD [Bacteroidetes bacterium]|nr:membrane protein insertion efficiency factor YidD [Bacteroidota bacterium]